MTGDEWKLLARAWKQFRKTWWLFLLLLALSVSAAFGYNYLLRTDVYEAYASFSVSVRNQSPGMSSYNTRISLKKLGETFPYIMESGALQTIVCEELGLSSLPVTISSKVVTDTNLFQIVVSGKDPEMTRRVLDAVIENYPQVSKYIIGKTAMTLIDYSGVPTIPKNIVSNRLLILYGAAIATTLYLTILVVLCMTRETVENENDLKRYTNLRCLATISRTYLKQRSGKRQPLLLIGQKSVSPAFTEAIHLLRIRTLREMDRRKAKTLLLTSAGEGEGKSTVAANLALSFAQKGFHVLLIDGDLRRPSLAEKFGMEAKAGTADVLSGRVRIEDAIQSYGSPNAMDVLPGRGSVRATAIPRILRQQAIAELIAYGRAHYDYVFVDTPPCGMIQDALLFADNCDSTMTVIRQDFLARTRVLNVIDLLAGTNAGILGYVINAETGEIGSYGYGRYGYGSGYGKYGKYGKYGRYGKYGSTSTEKAD